MDDTTTIPSYPFLFSSLREGDPDPTLKKKVAWLIDSDDSFIVYLDEDGYVEWNMNSNDQLGPEASLLLNRVGYLEAIDTSCLPAKRVATYQRMIGEGVARLFQKNTEAAQAAFDLAEKWITARNTEVARGWYLIGSGFAALLSALAVLILGTWHAGITQAYGTSAYGILMGSAMGGLGAWLSVIHRSRAAELDVAAGRLLHYLEGAFRIMVGMLGALLIALAIQAGLIAKFDRLAAIMVVCMVAGISERLVPSFIEQIESKTRSSDK